jgi:pimeloyl-ACP methyl ester carboxylesterase
VPADIQEGNGLMRFTAETIADGLWERSFVLDGVPGVLWAPAGAVTGHPLILLAHGGGQHKKAPGVVARARRYVAGYGFTVVAIDAPGHGERPGTSGDEALVAAIRERAAAGQPGPELARYHGELAAQAGFWGVSLGTWMGVPLAAAERRIGAAVFGLAGHQSLAATAARLTIPVEFLLQWDDELVPREAGLTLFGAFGSREKTLHANPGRHGEVPGFELESSARFFARHLAR